jgi:hypothetical protein
MSIEKYYGDPHGEPMYYASDVDPLIAALALVTASRDNIINEHRRMTLLYCDLKAEMTKLRKAKP